MSELGQSLPIWVLCYSNVEIKTIYAWVGIIKSKIKKPKLKLAALAA